MNLSHRLRLALVSTLVTGVLLGALFGVIVHFARGSALSGKQAELSSALASFTPPEDEHFDLGEFRDAHPELSASVFDLTGRRVASVGRHPPRHVRGFAIDRGWLDVGARFKGQDVAIALDLSETQQGLHELATVLGAIWIPLTLLVGGVTWAAAQSVFRPLERLSAQALAMSGTDLSDRLVTLDRAEFGAFARRLNEMLDRIEETVQRGERFSTDAAHELRTPLAILRTRLETTLIRTRTTEEYEATLRRSVAEIGRLTAITESLLRSARGEVDPTEAIDLRPIVDETVERWKERFDERGVRLQKSASDASVELLPDEARIVLDNLLDNALRYAPARSSVVVRLGTTGTGSQLSVRDRGPGIPAELGERVFDRLVRADDSRNRASGGAGIGLAVCRQIVEARGGRMAIFEAADGGAEVGCRFPSAARLRPSER